MQIAKIAVEAATYAIDKPYSYGVPAGMDVSVGFRVLVPFGRGKPHQRGDRPFVGGGFAEWPAEGAAPEPGRRSGDLSAGDQAGILDAAAVFLHVL